MCGGGGGTNAHDAEIARQEREEIRRQEEAKAAAEAARKAEEAEELRRWEGSLDSAYNNALSDAEAFFYSMGVEPDAYMGDIARAARSAKDSTPELSTDIGSYFDALGQNVFNQLQTAERAKAARPFNEFAREGFARNLITDQADDAVVNAILGEERQKSVNDLDMLVKRGILNEAGYNSAINSLDDQSFGAKSAIEELTSALIAGGRADLRDIASTGRSAANQLNLGEQFDAYEYQRQINDEVKNFFAGLGEQARGGLTTDLFDTSSAYNRGGASQGAGNGAYDLSAALGAFDDLEDDEDEDEDKWFADF